MRKRYNSTTGAALSSADLAWKKHADKNNERIGKRFAAQQVNVKR